MQREGGRERNGKYIKGKERGTQTERERKSGRDGEWEREGKERGGRGEVKGFSPPGTFSINILNTFPSERAPKYWTIFLCWR